MVWIVHFFAVVTLYFEQYGSWCTKNFDGIKSSKRKIPDPSSEEIPRKSPQKHKDYFQIYKSVKENRRKYTEMHVYQRTFTRFLHGTFPVLGNNEKIQHPKVPTGRSCSRTNSWNNPYSSRYYFYFLKGETNDIHDLLFFFSFGLGGGFI